MLKQVKRMAKAGLAVIMVLSLSIPVFAQTSKDVEENISNMEAEKESIESRISQLEANKTTTQAYINDLDVEIKGIQAQINIKEQELDVLNGEIDITQAELETAQKKEASQYEALRKRIKVMYEKGDTGYVEILLNAEDISSLLNSTEYISKISDYDNNLLNALKETREQIAAYEVELQAQKVDLEVIKADLEAQNDELNIVLEAKSNELMLLDSEHQSQLKELYAIEEDIESEKLIAERLKAAEAEAAARAATINMDVKYDPSAGFVWPVPGHKSISSPYGQRMCPFHGPEFHPAIDIPAPAGAGVVATTDGVVIAQSYDSGMGNYIIIDHGNGIQSYYLHNSSVIVGVGQKVTKGEVIAGVGTTGSSTGNHLDFRIKVNGSFVNPLAYVTPY